MASTKGINSNIFQFLMLVQCCCMAHQVPVNESMGTSDLLTNLRTKIEKAEHALAGIGMSPVLRRRIKSPFMSGRRRPARGYTLSGSTQLKMDEAYSMFLRNHLRVKDEKTLSPNFAIEHPASTSHTGKLYCKSRYLIEVRPNGEVRGTRNFNSPYTKLTILMHARQIVIIRTEAKPHRYLVMARNSKVKTIEKPTIESVLYYRAVDANKPNMYVVFRKAYKRREWFLALRDKGAYATVRKGRNTNPNRKSAHFIFLGDTKKEDTNS